MSTPVVKYPDPILTTPCQEFDFINPPIDPKTLADALMTAMYDHNGIGIAANQLNIPLRVFAIRGPEFNYVCFNPKIVYHSEKTNTLYEGCLSFPGLFIKIKRPEEIRVRFQTPSGVVDTKTFGGMTARIFQHELDHLDGQLFFNKANKFHRDQALRKWKP